LVAAAAYMARMERLYAVDLVVAADDGNDGGGGRGGEASAPGGDGIARVNGQGRRRRQRWRRRRRRGWRTAMVTAQPTATGGPSRTVTAKTGTGAPHPALGG
jgi:hypothetical protein